MKEAKSPKSKMQGLCRMRATRGFTLIELLVVIAVIAVLASLVLPTLGSAKRKALSAACLSNLHQIGLALDLYVQDSNDRIPSCAELPSINTNLPSMTTVLGPYLRSKGEAPTGMSALLFKCPEDRTVFPVEQTSYEWNMYLNSASYGHPEDWSAATQAIVDTIFGGRVNTPLCSDAEAFHPASGVWTGKNALYFEGRVQKCRTLSH